MGSLNGVQSAVAGIGSAPDQEPPSRESAFVAFRTWGLLTIQETKMRGSLFRRTLGHTPRFFSTGGIRLQARFGVSGGLAVPLDDLGDIADAGYDVSAALHFGGTHVPIGPRRGKPGWLQPQGCR